MKNILFTLTVFTLFMMPTLTVGPEAWCDIYPWWPGCSLLQS